MAIDLYKNRCSVYEGEKPYIFVSYSHRDIEKVVKLIRQLQSLGFRVWYDSGVPAGTEWREVIAAHLKNSGCVLALLTSNSVESKQFKREFNYADYLEKDILAVYLEECEPSPGLEIQVASQQCIKCEHCENDDDLLEAIAGAQILLPCRGSAEDPMPPDTTPDPAPGRNKTNSKIEELLEKAEKGDMAAQFDLAWAYSHGEDVVQDPTEAVKWYTRAAKQGNRTAQFNLGIMYATGNGVPQNDEEAAKWYRMSADANDPGAMRALGLCYEHGRGVNKDEKEAVRLYHRAAELGHLGSINALGYCYSHGVGVETDMKQAVAFYRQAAEQGEKYAQQNLAQCYEQGNGVEQNWVLAVYWYRKSAEQGLPYTQWKMADLYRKGLGVPIDEAEADRWQRLYDENPNK